MLDGGDDDDKHRNKSRLQTLSNIMKDLNLVSVVNNQQTQTPMQSPIRVSVKQFHHRAANCRTVYYSFLLQRIASSCSKSLKSMNNSIKRSFMNASSLINHIFK